MKTDQEMVRWALEESSEPVIKNPYLRSMFAGGQLVQPGPGRLGFDKGKTVRGSTIAMQEPVEFYVDIIRKMVSDNKYVPPVNINPREVGRIPNFLKAKELVKAETGESFDVLYDRNIQKRKKIKRALDPKKKEMDLISMAERKGRRRALKVDPSDPVKITDRERAINFEQRKYNKNLNLKIRQNPDIILKDKALMDKLSTTVSKEGNIIKVKPTLDDIKNRGIIEIEHQRDIFKKGKLKDLPYNRNFILGPYNRKGGFKQTAETFIEKNPDANNVKVKNIIKKAEELGVTLQPDVPKGTFPTKSVGYKQVGGPVEKFSNAAAHSFKGSTFEQKFLKTTSSGGPALHSFPANLLPMWKKMGAVPRKALGWFGADIGFYYLDKWNEMSKGKSEKEAAGIALNNATLGAYKNKTYIEGLKKTAKEMGIDPRAFENVYKVNEKMAKVQKQHETYQARIEKLKGMDASPQRDKALESITNAYNTWQQNMDPEIDKWVQGVVDDISISKTGGIASPLELSKARESLTEEDWQKPFIDIQNVALGKLEKEKAAAYDMQSKQVNPEAGNIGDWLLTNIFTTDAPGKAKEQERIDDMLDFDPKELYRYNIDRGLDPDAPITWEAYNTLKSAHPGLGFSGAQGGIASLKK